MRLAIILAAAFTLATPAKSQNRDIAYDDILAVTRMFDFGFTFPGQFDWDAKSPTEVQSEDGTLIIARDAKDPCVFEMRNRADHSVVYIDFSEWTGEYWSNGPDTRLLGRGGPFTCKRVMSETERADPAIRSFTAKQCRTFLYLMTTGQERQLIAKRAMEHIANYTCPTQKPQPY